MSREGGRLGPMWRPVGGAVDIAVVVGAEEPGRLVPGQGDERRPVARLPVLPPSVETMKPFGTVGGHDVVAVAGIDGEGDEPAGRAGVPGPLIRGHHEPAGHRIPTVGLAV